MINSIPVTVVIPTANRPKALKATLESVAKQAYQPNEIIIVDASSDKETAAICAGVFTGLQSIILYRQAIEKGAAIQRKQGVEIAKYPVIFFMDDDIILEPACVEKLWNGLQSDSGVGAVNAMITNQRYQTPGSVTRFMYRILSGEKLASYAGKCIGPAWNLLPEDRAELPEYNEVEWLNTTCTLYRKEALPTPLFSPHFQGYSLLEDVALSLKVGRNYKLLNARTARIFHDSQPGIHKSSPLQLAKMELVNRHYVMTAILKRNKFSDHGKLFLFELFGMVAVLTTMQGWKNLIPVVAGKLSAIATIVFKKTNYE